MILKTPIWLVHLAANQSSVMSIPNSNHNKLFYQIHDNDITTMLWMNGCNAMLKWEKSRKSSKSTKVAYCSHTDICKIKESCTRKLGGGEDRHTCNMEGGERIGKCPWWRGRRPPPRNLKIRCCQRKF